MNNNKNKSFFEALGEWLVSDKNTDYQDFEREWKENIKNKGQ